MALAASSYACLTPLPGLPDPPHNSSSRNSLCTAHLPSQWVRSPYTCVHIHHNSDPFLYRPTTLNYRARSILQTNSPGYTASHMPYTAAGLSGASQIVAIADTGLDDASCYFSDSTNGKLHHGYTISYTSACIYANFIVVYYRYVL